LLSAHRWKAVGAAAIVVFGVLVGLGVIDFNRMSSSVASYVSAPSKTAGVQADGDADTASAPEGAAGVDVAEAATVAPSITPCFTPGENCTEIAIAAIDRARSEILIQAFSLTRASVIEALGRAHTRGVKVRVILDKADEKQRIKGGSRLIAQRILPQIDEGAEVAGSNVIVIDHDTVITSSFAYNSVAEKKNAEDVLVIAGHPEIVAAYRKNWERRLVKTRPYYGTMAPVL
jgi:phosphatidylserine/phosphatidylglycerophosphate/cardiolipin synthase-like enzyme